MKNPVKKKLRNFEVALGSWIHFSDSQTVEIMARSGFEWLGIDLEHSSLSIHDAANIIQIVSLAGCVPIVRVTSNNADQVKRVLDAGAMGIIFPMINSADDAEKAVQAVKYPPVGARSVGIFRAHGYGADFDEYVKNFNREILLAVQIEHRDAVENINALFSVPGIDAYFLGPYDLSASYGETGNLNSPKVKQATQKVLTAAKAFNIVPGIHVVHPPTSQVKKRVGEGYRLIAYRSDMLMLSQVSKDSFKDTIQFVPPRRK